MSELANPEDAPRIEARHRMRIAAEWAGVKLGRMATELDLSPDTISNYLSGRTKPPRPVLIAWALRCGVPLAWIESGEVTPPDDGGEQAGRTSRWNAGTLSLVELDQAA